MSPASVGYAHHQTIFKPFKPFTRESLQDVVRRKESKTKRTSLPYQESRTKPKPDPYLASGLQLPPAFQRQIPPELIGKPIEDIDRFYSDKETFVIVSKGRDIFRFSAKEALFCLDPFNPIRRVALYILVNPLFSLLVILTILINCVLMTLQSNDSKEAKDTPVEKTEIIFTIIYTIEMCLKVLARGFIFEEFTYLRDPWNWLDFSVIVMAYLTIGVDDSGNLSVIRTFRVLRALKTVAIVPGMKTIVGAVIDSVKNLKDVVVLTLFSLSVFALLGLQVYMGQLTQKCIRNGSTNMTDEQWFEWCNSTANWYYKDTEDDAWLCGNSSGAQQCPKNYTCLQGFGPNPDYGFTSFDTFGWALISSFRLMTQDFWEGLYQQVLRAAGPWHIIFFIISIFLGSIYLMNLILAIVAMSYNELQRRAEEEEEAAAAEDAMFLESCRLEQEQRSENGSYRGRRGLYRPSMELGLAGQALIAGICPKGMLSPQDQKRLSQVTQYHRDSFLPDVSPMNELQRRSRGASSAIGENSAKSNVLPITKVESSCSNQNGQEIKDHRSASTYGAEMSKGNTTVSLQRKAAQIRINSYSLPGSPSKRESKTSVGNNYLSPNHAHVLLSINSNDQDQQSKKQLIHHQSLQPLPYTYRDSEDDLLEQESTNKLRANSHDCTPPNSNIARLSVSSCRGDYTRHGTNSQQKKSDEPKRYELSLLDSASVSNINRSDNTLTSGRLAVKSSAMNRLSVENFQKFGQRQHSTASNSIILLRADNSRHRPSQTTTEYCRSEDRPGLDAANYMNCRRRNTRRSSNWSRLSVSGNVDLRRIIRLWSTNNPYNRRNSGSLSNKSYNYVSGYTSPVHSIQFGSSRPSRSSTGSRQAIELISALNRYRCPDPNMECDINFDEDMDKVSLSWRDQCVGYCLDCVDMLCIWQCCPLWLKIQRVISLIVFDPFMELFITLCIVINTAFMAMDNSELDDDLNSFLEKGNIFFTATFAVEASMKIMALSPKFYFREGWNVFDFLIVGLSLLELGLENLEIPWISVLRTFRLLRVFKLAKSWPTLNLLISIMGKAVGDLGNLTFVLAIIVFIFAVMGMQLFGKSYEQEKKKFPDEKLPRWNFTDFMHSFMIVFRILCAEWIEPMWDCLLVAGWPCIPFFLVAVTVGNLVVLNLFLALLLASFGAANLSSPQVESVDTKKLQEAIERFKKAGRFIKKHTTHFIRFILCRKKFKEVGDSKKKSKSMRIVRLSKQDRSKRIEQHANLLKKGIYTKNHCYADTKISISPPDDVEIKNEDASVINENDNCFVKIECIQQDIPVNQEYDHEQQNLPRESSQFDEGQMSRRCSSSGSNSLSSHRMSYILRNDMRRPSATTLQSMIGCTQTNHPIELLSTSCGSSMFTKSPTNEMQPIKEDSFDNSSTCSLSNIDDKTVKIDENTKPLSNQSNREANYDDGNHSKKNVSTFTMRVQNPPSQQANEIQLTKVNQDNEKVEEQEENNSGLANEEELAREKSNFKTYYLQGPDKEDMEEEDERDLEYIDMLMEKSVCIGSIFLRWFLFRRFIRKIVEHRYFDTGILILIVLSSCTLALEDVYLKDRPTLKMILNILDNIFTMVFSLEMLMKWCAFGLRRYFGNIWCWLDFIIVLVSLINLMAELLGSGKFQPLKTMRTLRAMRGLRPLRALSRFQGMRVVVNALIQAIPAIFNVLLVCLMFWLIFAIMGVQMFGKKFYRCVDSKQEVLYGEDIKSHDDCIQRNQTWSNPQINFDNVLNAYLALFQVATFKGWIDIMDSATDSIDLNMQPQREARVYMYFYFVFFVIFGSFFTLNLFIGVIIDNFNEQKKKTGGSLEIFMTEDQKKYYNAMKKMRSKKPVKAMTRPKFKFQAWMFDITTDKKFDMVIMVIIGLNMFVMALEHYGQSAYFTMVLERLNLIFIAIFTLESLLKIFAMRLFYFREPWNIFDTCVVVLSILGVVMKEYVAKYFVSPTLLRVVRVVKVGRVLRLVKGAKGIRTLLFALAMSLPALFNICLLLFLVMFIYAIFGMSFFMNVRPRSGIDGTFNFKTFFSSLTLLFQMSTSAGWDLVLDPLMDDVNNCTQPDPVKLIDGDCGNKGIAIAYLVSYVIITFLIIINMYIAVILENYSQATEEVQEGLTDDDYDMYYEIWQKFDPRGTQFLPYDKLSDFVDALEDPLRIPKPNTLALVLLDIIVYKGNVCYCVDILDALTKHFFTSKGLIIQVNEQLQQVQTTLHKAQFEKLTTTYLLQRQHYCARLIQNCWRRWKQHTLQKQSDCEEVVKVSS